MNSITGSILIDFQNMPGSEEEKDYHKQVYGAIKLHLSEMEKYEKTSHFNICTKCGMILTKEVREMICRIRAQSMTGKRSTPILVNSRRSSKNAKRNLTISSCGFAPSARLRT
jgi:ribosomal protein L37E